MCNYYKKERSSYSIEEEEVDETLISIVDNRKWSIMKLGFVAIAVSLVLIIALRSSVLSSELFHKAIVPEILNNF